MGVFASNKLQPTKHNSQPDVSSYRWHTSRASLSRHAIIILALFCNAVIAGLALVVQYVEIPISNADIPKIGSLTVKYTYSSLLAPAASLLGSISGFVTTTAVALLVNSYAKSLGLREGLTFRKIEHLSRLSGSGVPLTFSPIFFLAILLLIADSFTRSSIVASLTPTEGLLASDDTIPFRSFGSFADEDIPVRCYYPERGYGYGEKCPMNDRYGTMYDGGVMKLQGTLPHNLTRRGVTYPKELIGIAGYVSDLSRELTRSVSNNKTDTVGAQTFLQTCVPRMEVTVTCQPNLDGTGMTFEDQGNTGTAVSFMNVHQARFCKRSGKCEGLQRADYSNGAIWVLTDDPYENGDMPLIIVGVGKYATENMQTNTLYCRVSSREEVIGIQIRGTALHKVEGLDCPTPEQPSFSFIQNVNFLAQMAMQKQQGEDGRLEILALVGDGSNTAAERLAPGIQTMVQLGATEMYTALSNASNARDVVQYSLLAQQMRLGQKGQLYQLFVVPPVIYLILLVIGWLWLGFRWSGGAHFSPLDPVQMAVAGAATDPNGSASYAFRRLAGAPTELIDDRVKAKIRLAEVQPERLGLSIDPVSMVPRPKKGAYYGGESVMSPGHYDPKMGTPSPYGAPLSAQPQSYFPPSVQPLSPGAPQYGAHNEYGQQGPTYGH